jgi:hypothetical protein
LVLVVAAALLLLELEVRVVMEAIGAVVISLAVPVLAVPVDIPAAEVAEGQELKEDVMAPQQIKLVLRVVEVAVEALQVQIILVQVEVAVEV